MWNITSGKAVWPWWCEVKRKSLVKVSEYLAEIWRSNTSPASGLYLHKHFITQTINKRKQRTFLYFGLTGLESRLFLHGWSVARPSGPRLEYSSLNQPVCFGSVPRGASAHFTLKWAAKAYVYSQKSFKLVYRPVKTVHDIFSQVEFGLLFLKLLGYHPSPRLLNEWRDSTTRTDLSFRSCYLFSIFLPRVCKLLHSITTFESVLKL